MYFCSRGLPQRWELPLAFRTYWFHFGLYLIWLGWTVATTAAAPFHSGGSLALAFRTNSFDFGSDLICSSLNYSYLLICAFPQCREGQPFPGQWLSITSLYLAYCCNIARLQHRLLDESWILTIYLKAIIWAIVEFWLIIER